VKVDRGREEDADRRDTIDLLQVRNWKAGARSTEG
jgi:hypothetical protein